MVAIQSQSHRGSSLIWYIKTAILHFHVNARFHLKIFQKKFGKLMGTLCTRVIMHGKRHRSSEISSRHLLGPPWHQLLILLTDWFHYPESVMMLAYSTRINPDQPAMILKSG